MRSQSFDIFIPDVLEQIAVVGLHERLNEVIAGRLPVESWLSVESRLNRFKGFYTLGSMCTFADRK